MMQTQLASRTSLMGALLLAFCALCDGQNREADATKAHQEFQKDWSDYAADKAARLLADDLVWVGAFGGIREKTAVVNGLRKRTTTRPQHEEQTRVRAFGDISIVTMLVTTQDDKDPNLLRKMYMTEVWAKRRGEWKLISFHSSLAAEPGR